MMIKTIIHHLAFIRLTMWSYVADEQRTKDVWFFWESSRNILVVRFGVTCRVEAMWEVL